MNVQPADTGPRPGRCYHGHQQGVGRAHYPGQVRPEQVVLPPPSGRSKAIRTSAPKRGGRRECAPPTRASRQRTRPPAPLPNREINPGKYYNPPAPSGTWLGNLRCPHRLGLIAQNPPMPAPSRNQAEQHRGEVRRRSLAICIAEDKSSPGHHQQHEAPVPPSGRHRQRGLRRWRPPPPGP